jgi:predicted ArsR family transcriptional regulator
MSTTVPVMGDPEDDDRLNETDSDIVALLADGRETTGSLAAQLDKHPQTIRDRLKWLREWDYVRYHHKPTGLHELSDEASADR